MKENGLQERILRKAQDEAEKRIKAGAVLNGFDLKMILREVIDRELHGEEANGKDDGD